MINKEVQKLAESMPYSYEDTLAIYKYHDSNIKITKMVLQLLSLHAISSRLYIKRLLEDGVDILF